MNLKNLKLDLPPTWREASRMGNKNQVVIRIYHISPISRIDSKRLQDQPVASGDPNTAITRVGIPTPTGAAPLSGFYEDMKAAVTSGFMPGWTMDKLNDLWKGMTATPHGERPGESDMANDLDILQCQDEDIAWQTLKNKAMMPTQGFDVPIPGMGAVPGMPKNMTMNQWLQSDMLKKIVPKDQFEKLQTALKEVKQKMPQVKQSYDKAGIKYKEGKLFGCKAIYFESPNPTPPPKPKPKTPTGKSATGGGGYGNTSIDPLPKAVKPYSTTNTFYLGIVFKNFVINGSLLSAIDSLSPGNTPCYSLTQTKEVVCKSREGGATFTDIAIVPLVSSYAKEGYLYKEEAEKIYRDIITKLG